MAWVYNRTDEEQAQIDKQLAAAKEAARNNRATGSSRLAVDGKRGYHQNNKRLTIVPEEEGVGGGHALRCGYDPTEFTETYSAEWANVPIVGVGPGQPIEFKFASPRKWSMRLFMNTLGLDVDSPAAFPSPVDGQLNLLRMFMMPTGYGGLGSRVGGDRPPTLLVFLTTDVFRCVLTEMTVVRKNLHPLSRETTRAEVDVVFTEFVGSQI